MEQTTETSILRLIRPIAFAASFVLAILVFCCRGDNPFMLYFDLYGAMDELIAFFGAGALGCCFLLLLVPSESMRARAVWTACSTIACLAGLACALLINPLDATGSAIACGILLGFGTIGLTGQWCYVFAQLPQRTIPFSIAMSFFFATLLWFILQIVNSFAISCIALMVFSLCGGLLLALSFPAQRAIETRRQEEKPTGQSIGQATGQATGYAANGPQTRDAAEAPGDTAGAADAVPSTEAEPSSHAKPVKVRPALTLLDSFTMKSNTSVSWEHAFEALGAVIVSFFILGVMYWPGATDIAQTRAFLKPLGYALASIVVFAVSARGAMSSLASGGMDRIRRTVIIAATLLALVSVFLLASSAARTHVALRLVNNFSLAVLMLFGFITSFIHILRHDPSPTLACAIIVMCAGIGLSLGIAAFIVLGGNAYLAAAVVAALFLVVLTVFTVLGKGASPRAAGGRNSTS